MQWISAIGMGILLGCVGRVSISLSYFIHKIEDGVECGRCGKRKECFARSYIPGTDSRYIDEFTLYAFCRVKGICPFWRENGRVQDLLFVACNVLLTGLLFWSKESLVEIILYGVTTAALLSLSVVDWKTQYIPLEYNLIILFCGLIRLFTDLSNWGEYLIGLIAVSGFLFVVDWLVTPIMRKRYEGEQEIDNVIGGGDVKLMAATGLLLGWKLSLLALMVGCVAGSVIHVMLMLIKGSGRQFAFGPYLSLGIYITMIYGKQLVGWYLSMWGIVPL